jgi:hypothetical protein
MIEARFCGRVGPISDCEPVYCGDLSWGLRCPRCGDVDLLAWLSAEARDTLLREASNREQALSPTAAKL